jgi:ribonuclease P protein component
MKRPPSISSKRDFERALRSGSRNRTPFGTIFVAPGQNPDAPARLGLAVPSRVGGAVVRNRIKRRLRASFAAAQVSGGLDVVVRAGRPALSLGFQEMERAFAELGEAR